MSSAGGRRRSLLANAIESIGTTHVPTPTADAPVADDITVREKPAEATATPSFLDRRGIAFDEIARPVKRPTIRLNPSECSTWPGNARAYAATRLDSLASPI